MNKSPLQQVVDAATSFNVADKRRSSQPGYLERLGEDLKPKREEVEPTLDAMINDCFLEPGPGRIVVQPDGFKYKGRMIIPDNAKRNGTTGTILKIGQMCRLEFYHSDRLWRPLAPGDRIVYGTWTGTQLNFENRPSYRILSEEEVLSLVSEAATKLLDVEA